MGDFRYQQFCPLARATEILGERWTVLVLRELFCGPQRYSDLCRRLPGISTSVLSDRLARLEARGLVERRTTPPPAPAVQYAVTPVGESARGVLRELIRFGVRFLDPPRPDDHLEPEWLRVGLSAFAAHGPTPDLAVGIRVPDTDPELRFRVLGGPAGTRVAPEEGPADVWLCAAPLSILGLASGRLDPDEARTSGRIEVEGDAARLRDFAALFDLKTLIARPATG